MYESALVPVSISESSVAKEKRRWENQTNQHTMGHVDCPACKSVGRALMIAELDIANLPFPEACERWIAWRQSYRAKGTVVSYRAHFSALNVFFGKLTLATIMPGHLRCYQEQRLANQDDQWRCAAGPSYINHEVNTLKQMMEVAGEWDRLRRFYHPLALPKKRPQRVMTEEEEQQLFEAASRSPECYLAYLVASISNNTTATGAELRSLQMQHVILDTDEPCIDIPHEMVKNEYRARRIPLNEIAAKQFSRAMERARHLGCILPTDYVFPFRVKRGTYDPKRPASPSWIRKQWGELRRLSGLPWVRPHDMRHQAITRMLEFDVPEDTVRSVAGHVSQDILRRYSHQRYRAKRVAVDVLARPIGSSRKPVVRLDSPRDQMRKNSR